MEEMKLTGFQFKTLSFDDGKQVPGCQLYLSYPREGVTGLVSERVFVSEKKLGGFVPKIGCGVRLTYNRYGKVDSVAEV